MSRTQFVFFYLVMQALIFLSILRYSTSIEVIDLLGLSNLYDKDVTLMIDQTFFDINVVKMIVNLLLVYAIISLLINGTFYIFYKKLVQLNKLLACIRIGELVREWARIAMNVLIFGSSIFFIAPFTNILLNKFIGADDGILEMVMGRYMATMMVIGAMVLFSGFVIDVMKQNVFKNEYKKA
ncbi:hypothetical protein ACOMCU_00535 [Lysinibacillus sp. UGB7]|uniref:hypothetical protein n=1 Tax=Lysinibacillus sp. UGB7 TaxID=3411039 RepID=UPI003B8001E1